MVETLKNQWRKEKDLARDRGIERKGEMFRKYLEWLEKMSWTTRLFSLKTRGQDKKMEEVSGKKLDGQKGAEGLLAGSPVTSGRQKARPSADSEKMRIH